MRRQMTDCGGAITKSKQSERGFVQDSQERRDGSMIDNNNNME